MRSKGIYLGGNVVVESGNVFPLKAKYQVGEILEIEYTASQGILNHKRAQANEQLNQAYEKLLNAPVAVFIDMKEYLRRSFLGENLNVLYYTSKGIVVEDTHQNPGGLSDYPAY